VSAIRDLLARAQSAERVLAKTTADIRDRALDAMARAIEADAEAILAANARDLERSTDLSPALVDRLRLDPNRLTAMVRAIDEIRALPDPIGGRRSIGTGRSGIRVLRQRVPLGVVAIVYEARPNVTAECAALTLKSGNAVVLRGGKEAFESNRAIVRSIRSALERSRIPADAVGFVEDLAHEAVVELLGASGAIDLVIPRGGDKLMALVDAHARVPVIRHGQGICHVYIDGEADLDMGVEIAFNAKVQRPGVCNAMETLLVDEGVLDPVLGKLGPRLAERGVEIRADRASRAAFERAGVNVQAADAKDFDTEFLDLVLAVRAVSGLDEALAHIADHGTHHTASIVTTNAGRAERFLNEVDASCVLWNASTRFNDGGELGLGAEMGISTSKMHAYGPMSLIELTTEKLVVFGEGQIRK
jgi:glutamate-5-semialdehyde dehydrogenase